MAKLNSLVTAGFCVLVAKNRPGFLKIIWSWKADWGGKGIKKDRHPYRKAGLRWDVCTLMKWPQ